MSGSSDFSTAPCVVVLLVVLAFVIAWAVSASALKKRIAKAFQAYRESLNQLKSDPANPNLKEATLALGRHYSNLTRNRRGITTFDEVHLMNDINAASAGAGAPQSTAGTKEQMNPEERLARLNRLKQSGLINDQEYEKRKTEILQEL